MALEKKDLDAIRVLMREEIKLELDPFREEVREKFNEVANNFDALFLDNEKREQEYLLLRAQVSRLEGRVEAVEKKVA